MRDFSLFLLEAEINAAEYDRLYRICCGHLHDLIFSAAAISILVLTLRFDRNVVKEVTGV
jgi:hypothetical protein